MTELPLQPPDDSNRRPRRLTYLAFLAMAIGGIGTLGCGIQPLSLSFATYKAGGFQTESGAILPFDRGLLNFTIACAIFDLLTSAALFVTAYAAFRRWSWGRRAAVTVSAVIVVVALLKMTGSLTAFRQPLIDIRMSAIAVLTPEQQKNVPADYAEQIQKMSYLGPLLMFVIQSFAPALILLVWTRPSMQSAFKPSPPSGFEVLPQKNDH
ncbi:hypothetical protein [Humisphaera borealis]|uniref:Uncharacterized protein n=1 Tax=Humisphaera borealis TaxID=2807512 RepID=A0A7M2WUA7_9BACT|nr:hypothetical protein [Humisphaera borealis]QOV89107.1 hypothetical protein IPV69_23270 [Humisphaera borealis]